MGNTLDPAMAAEAAERRKRAVEAGCPVVHFDYTHKKPALTYWDEFDKLRANRPVAYSDLGPGFWMLLTSELVRDAYQTPEVFSSSATIPTVPHPDWQWIPTMIDPPEHADYREILNIAFPARFGRAGGPHRCVGAHLARAEPAIALEEWHRLIPQFEVANTDGLVESGPQIGLEKLHLRWP